MSISVRFPFHDCYTNDEFEVLDYMQEYIEESSMESEKFWEDVKKNIHLLTPEMKELFFLKFPEEKENDTTQEEITDSNSETDKSEVESNKPSLMSSQELENIMNKNKIDEDSFYNSSAIENEKFKKIPLNMLREYHNNIFSPQDDDTFNSLVESIRKNGVREPIIVRYIDDFNYEILAGHNRAKACRELGLKDIKAIVLYNLTDEESEGIYIESNLVRRDMSQRPPSELAKVFKSYMELKDTIGEKKYEEIRYNLAHEKNMIDTKKLSTRDIIAYHTGISARNIANYVRLNDLINPLLEKVDKDRISFTSGVELSFADKRIQEITNEILDELEERKLSIAQARALRYLEKDASNERIRRIIIPTKESESNVMQLYLGREFLLNFFPVDADKSTMRETIREALKQYTNRS